MPPKPEPQNTPARDRLPPTFSTGGTRVCRPDAGRAARLRFGTSVATGHSAVSTTVSITGDLTLNTSTLTPQGTMKNVLVPSLQIRCCISVSQQTVCVYVQRLIKRRHSFLPDASHGCTLSQ